MLKITLKQGRGSMELHIVPDHTIKAGHKALNKSLDSIYVHPDDYNKIEASWSGREVSSYIDTLLPIRRKKK